MFNLVSDLRYLKVFLGELLLHSNNVRGQLIYSEIYNAKIYLS